MANVEIWLERRHEYSSEVEAATCRLQNLYVQAIISRGMSLGLKVRFLRATAFPIAIYGCESLAMTSCDKKRVDGFELWCYRRRTERKTNKWVLEKIGSVLM